jgi:basic membrane lipoprotein Med (substrate-binding protein (PBP1-ABC) superfamily)
VTAALDGTWTSTDTWGGIADGMVELAPFGPGVPEDVRALVTERQAEIAGGTLHPFAGPVLDNQGAERVPQGSTPSDEDLLGMDYFVEGVVGTLPQ